MRPFRLLVAAAALGGLFAAPAGAASRFNWNALGLEFCRLTLAGDIAGLRPLLTADLRAALDTAAANPELTSPGVLFQSYSNEVPVCEAQTRNAALVEIRRSSRGDGPSWTEYIVVVPEIDGTSRIDDVLFATRRSDTLRARLDYFAKVR
jgi:hypothetical protein